MERLSQIAFYANTATYCQQELESLHEMAERVASGHPVSIIAEVRGASFAQSLSPGIVGVQMPDADLFVVAEKIESDTLEILGIMIRSKEEALKNCIRELEKLGVPWKD